MRSALNSIKSAVNPIEYTANLIRSTLNQNGFAANHTWNTANPNGKTTKKGSSELSFG